MESKNTPSANDISGLSSRKTTPPLFKVPASTSESVPKQITVNQFYEAGKNLLGLELIAGKNGMGKLILEKVVNRPALALTGYYKHFARGRLQLFGAGEISYLSDLRSEIQHSVLETFFSKGVPAIVVSRDLAPTQTMVELADKYNVPIFRSHQDVFATNATIVLNELFAPQAIIHATLIDVTGVGVLLCGDSGAGKSECALSLIERNKCALVADDMVKIRLVDDNRLIGTGKDVGFGFMECRGIGIINVASMFGIRAVEKEKKIDLVISFVDWKEGLDEERTGLEQHTVNILGKEIPWMQIAVRPGRDVARLVLIAVMAHSLRKGGHDPAVEFNNRIISNNRRQEPGGGNEEI
ncbi:MAG: HPr(Ser) kinase/phosphatase [Opitutales bacterium]|nr:HPr(Ser) kinase/phosphatase [Opitutales bacterium]